MPRSVSLTDPRALRAYAHPTRMTLVGLLRRTGPFTATRAAELTGESVASCSYHLRMLAKYGLVEEAPGGRGREKPWQATASFTSWPTYSEDPSVAEAADALNTAVAEQYFERMVRATERRRELPREWQEAQQSGDTLLHLTAGELTELGERIDDLLKQYEPRQSDPSLRPEGAREVSLILAAFPESAPPEAGRPGEAGSPAAEAEPAGQEAQDR
ncbi:helix-turn-helix domain-containing protein [Streptomyces sp. NBC_01267]|uniref:winged helix-turn-helix domain-containing protein n=1 Tax=unclassified Streptomyces TaxID=2593676 RepID=UPI002024EA28|nr:MULTISPECIES: helix-turn-helix domain-containing protein [unclassified Streptomyces]WSV54534.1 helix-turn-helix domain-containing protein [Streptomyces sp. NBC_01014]